MIPGQPFTSLKITGGNQEQSQLSHIKNLKPGQIVDAKVLDVRPENRALLFIGGQKLTVSTQLPLTRGMNIPMKVVHSQDGILLRPVSPPSGPVSTDMPNTAVTTGRPVSSMPAALSDLNPLPGTKEYVQTTELKSFSMGKIFQGLSALSQTREPILHDILMGLSLKSDVRNDQFFPQIINNMGLSFEKKLADGLKDTPDKKTVAHLIKQLAGQDLKAASLSLAGMETDPGKASVLKDISNALDNFAQLNVKSADSGQSQDGARFLLPFPVWREDGFDFGQLMVDTGKTGTANAKKMLSISFLLNMTALGPLRADFSILDKTIAGRFLLEEQATCDYLAPKISDLRQRLSGIGYQAGNIDCQVARPEQIAPTSLILSMKEPEDMQGLNIII